MTSFLLIIIYLEYKYNVLGILQYLCNFYEKNIKEEWNTSRNIQVRFLLIHSFKNK